MKVVLSRDFCALIVSVAVVGLGIGATLPLVALALTQAGYGSHIVGMLAAAQAGGGLIVAPFSARIAARFGARHVISGAVCVASLATMSMQFSVDPLVWAPLGMLSGAALMLLFTISEAWVNQLADDRSRGRIVAIYATIFTLFQMAGPLLVSQIGDRPGSRFAICGAIFLLALPGLSLMRVAPSTGHDGATHSAWRTVLPRMPALVIGAGFFALFDTLSLALLPLLAIHHGVAVEVAVVFGSAILLGDTAFAFVLGWLADRFGRARVHLGAGLVVALLLPMLPASIETPWLRWPLLVILGAAAGGIYTLSLAAIGERFRGPALVTASSLIGASWSVASFFGPMIAGTLMRIAGPDALIGVLFAGVLAFIAAHGWEQRAARAIGTVRQTNLKSSTRAEPSRGTRRNRSGSHPPGTTP
jgi:MFS family permease